LKTNYQIFGKNIPDTTCHQRTKNYQNLLIGFQVTVKNVEDAFLGHSVVSFPLRGLQHNSSVYVVRCTEQVYFGLFHLPLSYSPDGSTMHDTVREISDGFYTMSQKMCGYFLNNFVTL